MRFSVFRYNHQIKIICRIKRRTGHQFASSEELPLAPLCVPAHTGRVLSPYLFWAVTRVLLPQPGAYLSGCSMRSASRAAAGGEERSGDLYSASRNPQRGPAGELWLPGLLPSVNYNTRACFWQQRTGCISPIAILVWELWQKCLWVLGWYEQRERFTPIVQCHLSVSAWDENYGVSVALFIKFHGYAPLVWEECLGRHSGLILPRGVHVLEGYI